MKEKVRNEYCIMHNGYYIKETDRQGLFYRVNDLDKATLFQSLDSTTSYIEHDLCLNLANVSIHEIKTVVTEVPLALVDGEFLSLDKVSWCSHEDCQGYHKVEDLQYYKYDNDSDVEAFCEKHYEEMCDNSPNMFHGNQDLDTQFNNPLGQLDDLINSLGVKK